MLVDDTHTAEPVVLQSAEKTESVLVLSEYETASKATAAGPADRAEPEVEESSSAASTLATSAAETDQAKDEVVVEKYEFTPVEVADVCTSLESSKEREVEVNENDSAYAHLPEEHHHDENMTEAIRDAVAPPAAVVIDTTSVVETQEPVLPNTSRSTAQDMSSQVAPLSEANVRSIETKATASKTSEIVAEKPAAQVPKAALQDDDVASLLSSSVEAIEEEVMEDMDPFRIEELSDSPKNTAQDETKNAVENKTQDLHVVDSAGGDKVDKRADSGAAVSSAPSNPEAVPVSHDVDEGVEQQVVEVPPTDTIEVTECVSPGKSTNQKSDSEVENASVEKGKGLSAVLRKIPVSASSGAPDRLEDAQAVAMGPFSADPISAISDQSDEDVRPDFNMMTSNDLDTTSKESLLEDLNSAQPESGSCAKDYNVLAQTSRLKQPIPLVTNHERFCNKMHDCITASAGVEEVGDLAVHALSKDENVKNHSTNINLDDSLAFAALEEVAGRNIEPVLTTADTTSSRDFSSRARESPSASSSNQVLVEDASYHGNASVAGTFYTASIGSNRDSFGLGGEEQTPRQNTSQAGDEFVDAVGDFADVVEEQSGSPEENYGRDNNFFVGSNPFR
ncbi:unnamed protein product [Amoebophrya sp. A25]|nr:unnamed protein product [Amoebophrya sp. A25]|eukprot:GSA25T00016707001.1